ncbi:unnamed protein product [Wickerhamomyces anomalus]
MKLPRTFLTNSIKSIKSFGRFQQVRNASVSNVRFIQKSSKVQDPLEKVGASNVDELKEKLKDKIEDTKKEFNKIDPLKELEEYERKQALEAQQKKLHEDKLRGPRKGGYTRKTIQNIELIQNSLISIVPSNVFDKLYKNARENPTFVLPLPRETEGGENDAFELHYVQWQFVGPNTVHCMFTTLLEFKTHKEFARPHTSLMFHTELKENKGLVLMNGTVEKDSAVKLPEAQLLLLNVQRFYGALADGEASKRRTKLLRDFTSGSSDFSVEALVAEAQSLEN